MPNQITDKNLPQAFLHDIGRHDLAKQGLSDTEISQMSDAEIRRAGLGNIASLTGAIVVSAALAAGSYNHLENKIHEEQQPAQQHETQNSIGDNTRSAEVLPNAQMPAAQTTDFENATYVQVDTPEQQG